MSAIELRYGQIGLLQGRLRTTDPGALLDELTGRVATAPQFFQQTALYLDLSTLEQQPEVAAVRGVIDTARRAGLLTVGLAEGPAWVPPLGKALGLPVLAGFRAAAREPANATAAVAAKNGAGEPAARAPGPGAGAGTGAAPAAGSASGSGIGQLHHQPVRSGQRVYARDRDLTVTAMVGAGAEVMADGNVHIYGVLRGRVMAGMRGESTARVFCQEFRAELVAIAGVFRVFETLPKDLAGHPVMAWLDDEELHFARLGG